jgi:hypothetical protein
MRGAAAFLATAGAAGLAAGIRPRMGRAILAALAAAFAGYLFAYRVEAVPDALRVRTLLGTTSLPWASITRVDATRDTLALISDRGRTQVETGELTGDPQRARPLSGSQRERPARHPEGSSFSEAALSCQEPRRPLPSVSPPSLVASVLSALFGEDWAKRTRMPYDRRYGPRTTVTPTPESTVTSVRPEWPSLCVSQTGGVCDDWRPLPRGSSPFSSRS